MINENDKIIMDAVLDTIQEKIKFTKLIPCRRCGWCCKNCNAGLMSEEVENICHYLSIDQNEFREKFATEDTKDNPNGMKIATPCPFLDKDMNCTIYEVRPLSCVLYPFSTTLLTIKPCEKGLEMYKTIEKWYIDHDDGSVKVNDMSTGIALKDFYNRNKQKVEFIDDANNPMELDEILKDESIKSHGIITIPDKKGLKKLCKYLIKNKHKS